MTEQELLRDSRAEFKALLSAAPFPLILTPLTAWAVFANLQLALRHPLNATGVIADRARTVAYYLEKHFLTPALCELARRGWDPAYKSDAPGSETQHQALYMLLEAQDLASDGALAGLLTAHGQSALTVCPVCALSDFMHDENCALEGAVKQQAAGIARELGCVFVAVQPGSGDIPACWMFNDPLTTNTLTVPAGSSREEIRRILAENRVKFTEV